MTPAEERALLDATAAGLDDDLRKAYEDFLRRVRAGEAPRDAVTAVMERFAGAMADTLSVAFGAILAQSVGSADVMRIEVGGMALSDKLYAQAREVSNVVQGIVERHANGWNDARALALQLYEGYGFRRPGDEPLKINRNNPLLPRYLREVLLPISELSDEIRRHLAGLQADGLTTQALRAAYLDVLRAFDALEDGKGWDAVEKALRVAFYEKARYQANRIAQTELHRVYAEARARELMDDPEVQWVQWRLSATHPEVDICDYLALVDRWGMGPGVYPADQAPVPPAHPHCRCILAPRLDLFGRRGLERPDAARAVFADAPDLRSAAKIAGSREKLERVMSGEDPLAVYNTNTDPLYKIKLSGSLR